MRFVSGRARKKGYYRSIRPSLGIQRGIVAPTYWLVGLGCMYEQLYAVERWIRGESSNLTVLVPTRPSLYSNGCREQKALTSLLSDWQTARSNRAAVTLGGDVHIGGFTDSWVSMNKKADRVLE